MGKTTWFTVWSAAFYFGWVLAFPYFGVAILPASPEAGMAAYQFTSAYLLSHALGYLAGALFLKQSFSWQYLMFGSLLGTVTVNILLWFVPAALWWPGFIFLGFISSFYILGWSRLYSMFFPAEKVFVIVHMAIRSNLIAVAIMVSAEWVSDPLLMGVILLPLLAAVWLFLSGQAEISQRFFTPLLKVSPYFPGLLMLILGLFIFAFKLSAGFMYSVIDYSYPVMDQYRVIYIYYGYLPFLLAHVLLLRFYRGLQRHYLAYAGVALLGLSFVAFALAGKSLASFVLTITLIEIAFALLNVFTWTLLGDLASSYGYPTRFFGFGLFAVLGGTFSGGLVGAYLLEQGDLPRMLSALYATAAIFLTLVIIPWLKEIIEESRAGLLLKDNQTRALAVEALLGRLYREVGLTDREKEVTRLLLMGFVNKMIAEKLFITENTLKTHLRSIYRKFKVANKRELFFRIKGKKHP